MKTAKDVLKSIKDQDVKYVDLRFTDPRGKWQHVTFDVTIFNEDVFAEGLGFDGSSIAGWRAIHESDMTLMPDPATATVDPFFAAPTMSIICDILDPTTRAPYNRDPRGIAKKAEAFVASTGIGDTAYFGPEAEFFVFDDVRFSCDPYNTGFIVEFGRISVEFGHSLRGRQSRSPDAHQGWLFPRAAAGFGAGHAWRDARRHGADGRQGRKAPPRGGFGAA